MMILSCPIALRPAAALIAAAMSCSCATVEAATPLYWPGSDFGYDRSAPYDAPPRIVRQPRMPKQQAAKAEELAKKVGKPTGPLVIAISIERQTMKVYDASGLFAETPISSGMKGHSTPMGVFSVIQKNKWHRSNIYSGAPMPYMQRLTWSGIAMHAGALPGYPASHGCVRLPMSFAVQMWGWTRMGARVVITPGDIAPATITHPLLTSIKPSPATPVASVPAPANAEPPMASNTKTADARASIESTTTSDAPATASPADETKNTASAVVAIPTLNETPINIEKSLTADKPAIAEVALSPALKRGGPIAVFVSRKDGKLYVRQNFAPLFDVPVVITGDEPLGTHIFTAQVDKDITKPTQWTGMTLPVPTRAPEDATLSRRRQSAGAISTIPTVHQISPSDALDRVTIPADVMARLGDSLTTGSSLIISDQGITASGETGEGTDFIVRLR